MGYNIRRTDKNQAEVVKFLRDKGALVAITSSMGAGFPDLVCSINDKIYLVEIKKDGKAKLTKCEQEFHELWKKHIAIIHSTEQAEKLFSE